jgi:hypothetical protein
MDTSTSDLLLLIPELKVTSRSESLILSTKVLQMNPLVSETSSLSMTTIQMLKKIEHGQLNHQVTTTMVWLRHLPYGRMTVELLRKHAKVTPTTVVTANVLKVIPSGESSTEIRCTQLPTKSNLSVRFGRLTHGTVRNSLFR